MLTVISMHSAHALEQYLELILNNIYHNVPRYKAGF